MPMSSKDKMVNWTRDFILYDMKQKGFCEEKDYVERFKLFKMAYQYDGKPLDLLRELKNNGSLSRTKGILIWLLPFDESEVRLKNNIDL